VAEEPTSPLERLVELFVYAPVGLALSAKEELPAIVDRGRRSLTSQVALARFVGKLALTRGTREATRFIGQAAERVASTRLPFEQEPGAEPAPMHDTFVRSDAVDGDADVGGGAEQPGTGDPTRPPPWWVTSSRNGDGPSAAVGGHDTPTEAQLAIPGYDSLSAPQVVQRLAGLAAAELDAVRRYEDAHRGRRTILSRIAQLQADPA